MDHGQNERAKTIIPLEENLGVNLYELGLRNDILDMIPKEYVIKYIIGKLDFINIQQICAFKNYEIYE